MRRKYFGIKKSSNASKSQTVAALIKAKGANSGGELAKLREYPSVNCLQASMEAANHMNTNVCDFRRTKCSERPDN